jgi:hypothetical protein
MCAVKLKERNLADIDYLCFLFKKRARVYEEGKGVWSDFKE